MVAAEASSALFSVRTPGTSPKPGKFRNWPSSLSVPFKSKSNHNGGFQVKANASARPKANGSAVSLKSGSLDTQEDTSSSSSPPRTFINQLPDWSMLLSAITTVFVAAEKQWTMLDRKSKRPDTLMDPFGVDRVVQDGVVFRQSFSIRSYEIGADRTASIETLMNIFQETSLNHCKSIGLLNDGFGRTPEMCKRDLIWVVTKMHIEVNRYPTWGDTIEVNTWVSESGKTGMGRDWLISDCHTGEILIRATSVCAMMNQTTRRFSKFPYEVRQELAPHFVDSAPVIEDYQKLHKLDVKTGDSICNGLTPRWNDLDVNQHVNNVKYIGWILESVPKEVFETQELCGLTLEYRRECGRDSVLKSVTAMDPSKEGDRSLYQHLLRLEDGTDIAKGRTKWRPKNAGTNGAISTGKTSNGNSIS
uniref:Acyl-[acyl-carrier-protein] hydrolase n=1 Tax=Cuphea calophylla subsp. mesostemon TaxID=312565 RepID=Q2Q1N8_9MYRT|nr:seed-specific acyl-acyl carrier protein thioesterase [Cuphea calophylla subsp. mesostemon]ABB71580.1 seed-specific acyl-acyl carrier protein thioesterase [Cuphea calophylla subsp. mesostemon]